MSRQGVAAFLSRVMEDGGFRDQLKANPEATLAQFELTPEEIAAIKSADASKLRELGVDERVSKTAETDILLPWTAVGTASASLDKLISVLRYIWNPP